MMGASIRELSNRTGLSISHIRDEFMRRDWRFRIPGGRNRGFVLNEIERISLMADLDPSHVLLLWALFCNNARLIKKMKQYLQDIGFDLSIADSGSVSDVEKFREEVKKIRDSEKTRFHSFVEEALYEGIGEDLYHKIR